MKRIVGLFSAFSLVVCLYGCSYHYQTNDDVPTKTYEAPSYRSSSSVGRLRRLAILPVHYETHRDNEDSSFDLKEQKAVFEEKVAEYLRNEKGYEVIVASRDIQDWHRIFQARWMTADEEDEISRIVVELSQYADIDGAVVLFGKDLKLWDTVDGFINIILMNGPLLYRMTVPNARAWIFDASQGQLVWSQERSNFGEAHGRKIFSYDDLVILFTDIENAIPGILVE